MANCACLNRLIFRSFFAGFSGYSKSFPLKRVEHLVISGPIVCSQRFWNDSQEWNHSWKIGYAFCSLDLSLVALWFLNSSTSKKRRPLHFSPKALLIFSEKKIRKQRKNNNVESNLLEKFLWNLYRVSEAFAKYDDGIQINRKQRVVCHCHAKSGNRTKTSRELKKSYFEMRLASILSERRNQWFVATLLLDCVKFKIFHMLFLP